MKSEPHNPIQTELRATGATPAETATLTQLTAALSRLRGAEPAAATAARAPWRTRRSWQLWPFGAGVAAGALLGIGLLAIAQTAVPGTWPYPLKRASETVAIWVQPAYRATVMMRRAEEVEQLVTRHSQPSLVSATLSDYRQTALDYKTKNYAAMEYCQHSLRQAETAATPMEHQEIAGTLAQLDLETD